MTVEGVIWLSEIVDKLFSKHRVTTHGVEEVLDNRPQFLFAERGNRENENVYLALGQTDAGRYLSVLFVFKQPREALILSARDMARKERRYYGKR